MALKRFGVGRGQLELNNVFFRREGAIEAQCALDPTKFATEGKEGNGKVYAENGMILAVDKANGIVTFATENNKDLPLALNYSTEHMYDERKENLGSYYLPAGTFYPRMGYIKKGEIFTTNCVGYDAEEFANNEAVKTAFDGKTAIYGVASEEGLIKITKTATDALLKVVKYYTMPDGTPGIKFQVIK